MRALWTAVVTCALATGCSTRPSPETPLPPLGREEARQAKVSFEQARAAFARHDQSQWTERSCRHTAELFDRVAKKLARLDRRASLAARYDRGLALSRCRLDVDAAKVFEALHADAPDHAGAKVQVAIRRYETRGATYLAEATAMVEEVVRATRFQDASALVALAILQLAEGRADREGSELERARMNLRRALAIDDRNMPAYNQLALLHLREAKSRVGQSAESYLALSGAPVARPDAIALDQAALICAQAQRLNDAYAPIHNTAGLVEAELGRFGAAARAFGRARELDPRFFEAHMNYAAVNLQFRGFTEAESAYRAALALEPESYEANLGLALALRGRIGEAADGMKLLAEAEGLLHRAKKLSPRRAEAYFNEAVLVEEFHARRGAPEAREMLTRARSLYLAFTDRARDQPGMDAAIARAAERVGDIDQILAFVQ